MNHQLIKKVLIKKFLITKSDPSQGLESRVYSDDQSTILY